jgi:hypothetical protein
MTGDQPDMLARIKAVLPTRWFADDTPILDGLLSGVAWGWAWVYSLYSYVQAQTRIATASDVWLDVIADDFFGSKLQRRSGQSDDAFRLLIESSLLSGRPPDVFEPIRTTDTGGYASAGLGYGVAGGWGSTALPFQCFVTAYRPFDSGIALVSGWGGAAGAYGTGALEYASLAMVQGQVTDQDINAAIAGVLPVATIAWTRISN